MKKLRTRLGRVIACASIGFAVLPASASIIGDPTMDPGWTSVGSSTVAGKYVDGTGAFQASVYTTSFNLAAGSPLVSSAGGLNWNVGDVIVGVGGVMSQTSADLTYGGGADSNGVAHTRATSARFVVKYGSAGATWTAPAGATGSSGSLGNGGVGSVLLGNAPYDFYPANSGTLVVPISSPQVQDTVNTSAAISPYVGRVVTNWTGATGSEVLNGFESYLDLTLLSSQVASATVALGNPLLLDIQRGTGNFQNSLFSVPATVPEPSMGLGAFIAMAALSRRRADRRRI